MKFISTIALLAVALQCTLTTAQLNFVRSDNRPVDFSALINPPVNAQDSSMAAPPTGGVGRYLRDGSNANVIIVGRNGGGLPPLRSGAITE
ncbi:hypothetical protein PRNP1_011808 [Phytophthora ramorum]